MSWLARDLRVGVRALRTHPGHTAASLIALGLGIGLTTATFSIVDGLLLRGLPFPESERLMLLGSEDPARGLHGGPVDLRDFADPSFRPPAQREPLLVLATASPPRLPAASPPASH
jgi:hypothetical protein